MSTAVDGHTSASDGALPGWFAGVAIVVVLFLLGILAYVFCSRRVNTGTAKAEEPALRIEMDSEHAVKTAMSLNADDSQDPPKYMKDDGPNGTSTDLELSRLDPPETFDDEQWQGQDVPTMGGSACMNIQGNEAGCVRGCAFLGA